MGVLLRAGPGGAERPYQLTLIAYRVDLPLSGICRRTLPTVPRGAPAG
jgi:hypothetical protein